jgi:hypothetical protein
VAKVMAKCELKPTLAKTAWFPYPFYGDLY